MSIDIRLPNINGKTDSEQLAQIRSYLYQFAGQLQWALSTMESGGGTNVVLQNGSSSTAAQEESAISNFNQIKNLIIKSADIINAYYEKIDNMLKLNGEFVAQSDFGVYSEQTSQTINANSTNITQLFTNLQEISDTVDALYDSTIATNAYLKTGLLEYDENGVPVYGIEVGQTNTVDGVEVFDKFARFSADRLSFYDSNDVEVAYISDYKLVITNAEIKGTLKLGGCELDTSIGIALKWVGR